MDAHSSPKDRDRASICLALIHNNDAQRNARIRPALSQLATSLTPGCDVRSTEVAYQAPLQMHDTHLAFRRDVMYQVLAYQWRKYRQLKTSIFDEVTQAIKFLWRKYLTGDRSAVERWRRSSAIETIVSDKHIRAWDIFLESDADFIICFEDDAVFRVDSIDKLGLVIEEVSSLPRNKNIYIDLAGGCELSDLYISQLIDRQTALFTYYRKPVTNTACCYLLSRSLVSKFREMLVSMPAIRLIGIDWMMNRLLMELERRGLDCICAHTSPTALKHGSVTGDFVAWER